MESCTEEICEFVQKAPKVMREFRIPGEHPDAWSKGQIQRDPVVMFKQKNGPCLKMLNMELRQKPCFFCCFFGVISVCAETLD